MKFGNSKTIWMYTGFTWETIYTLPFLKDVDVIVDGPFILEQRDVSLKWKGSPNQRVIDVKKTLASNTPNIPILYGDANDNTPSEVEEQLFDAKASSCCDN